MKIHTDLVFVHYYKKNAIFRACVDTTEEGDLEKCVVLGPYRKTRDFTPLTKSDQLHYSVNFHDNGNTLEIVSMCCKYWQFRNGDKLFDFFQYQQATEHT